MKGKALTRGGLGLGSVFLQTKKSAEVIVATSNEPLPIINRVKVEALQGSEGLNIKQLPC
jgi:hypothetical protein